MPYKNLTEVLKDAPKYLVAIEAKLPAGAPVISTRLLETADKVPVLPDFFMELPDLPAVPEIPEFPAGGAGLRRYVTGVTVTPAVTPMGAGAAAHRPAGVTLTSPQSRLVFE